MPFRFCLSLNNNLNVPSRDLSRSRKARSGRESSKIWAGTYSSGHVQCFGISPLSKCNLKQNCEMLKRVITRAIPKRHKTL